MKISIKTLSACSMAFVSTQLKAEDPAPKKMNIIFILADDLGWMDCTLNGPNALYETPNLERLAKRGMTFNRAYAASPLSSPTRSSILTGQTPARTGITSAAGHLEEVKLLPTVAVRAPVGEKALPCVSATRLDTIVPTLGKLIHSASYATAHFGKWHLGREPYSPLQHGFDVDIPHWPGPGPAGSYVGPWKFPTFKENYEAEHIEDRMSEEAVKWLRSIKKDQPFYMNYWQFSVHAPFDAKKKLVEYYRNKVDTTKAQRSATYAAMVHSMDDAVGTLLDEVDRLGIANNTVIIFFSDNGGNMYSSISETTKNGVKYTADPTSNAPLRGGKATVFEGGIRVPSIIVWPGLTKPGTRSDAMIQSTDFYPTILANLKISIPKNHPVDGYDITPVLKGQKWERKSMFTYFPQSPRVPDWLPPAMAVHVGDWKLIRLFYQGEDGKHGYLLYNLKEDICEKNNLALKNPKKVKELDQLITNYINEAKVVVPEPNPRFDWSKYHPELIGIQKKADKKGKEE